jgi:hypothetical protein
VQAGRPRALDVAGLVVDHQAGARLDAEASRREVEDLDVRLLQADVTGDIERPAKPTAARRS